MKPGHAKLLLCQVALMVVLVDSHVVNSVGGGVADKLAPGIDNFEEEFCFGLGEEFDSLGWLPSLAKKSAMTNRAYLRASRASQILVIGFLKIEEAAGLSVEPTRILLRN